MPSRTHKRCPICGELKPVTEFRQVPRRRRSDGTPAPRTPVAYCLPCERAYQRQRYAHRYRTDAGFRERERARMRRRYAERVAGSPNRLPPGWGGEGMQRPAQPGGEHSAGTPGDRRSPGNPHPASEIVIGPNGERLGPGRDGTLTLQRDGDRLRLVVTTQMDGRPVVLALTYLDAHHTLLLRDALIRWFGGSSEGLGSQPDGVRLGTLGD